MINSMRNPKDKVEGQELLPQEIEDAEKRIISLLQLEAFSEEYMALLTGKEEEFTVQAISLVGISRCNAVRRSTSSRRMSSLQRQISC